MPTLRHNASLVYLWPRAARIDAFLNGKSVAEFAWPPYFTDLRKIPIIGPPLDTGEFFFFLFSFFFRRGRRKSACLSTSSLFLFFFKFFFADCSFLLLFLSCFSPVSSPVSSPLSSPLSLLLHRRCWRKDGAWSLRAFLKSCARRFNSRGWRRRRRRRRRWVLIFFFFFFFTIYSLGLLLFFFFSWFWTILLLFPTFDTHDWFLYLLLLAIQRDEVREDDEKKIKISSRWVFNVGRYFYLYATTLTIDSYICYGFFSLRCRW